ncbi:hypothetical protein K2173_001233 [Erythroxylum novogranatense]|uniref:Uncharacterized protein n=1 Tax=Erythroxylum novogranatense TaxID=1862640 RepID=A0AAV8T3C7_9ROSI|nr:hypothetical protein K2173_001233 [Erythroxylum novogranatense]
MGPSSLHSSFFVSLKQVEKRLKLENTAQQPGKASPLPPPQEQHQNQLPLTDPNHSLVESLSLPIYLYSDQEPSTNNHGRSSAVFQESSEPPRPFMSCSLQLSPIQDNSPRQSSQLQTGSVHEAIRGDVKEIELLTQLLGLSDVIGKEQEQGKRRKESVVGSGGVCGCDCDVGFHEKVLGVKGHKCKKEVGRLEAWIKYFLESGGDEGEERSEDLKLVYLLLGRSAVEGADGDFGGLEFPSIIEEFLKFDPPRKCGSVKLFRAHPK